MSQADTQQQLFAELKETARGLGATAFGIASVEAMRAAGYDCPAPGDHPSRATCQPVDPGRSGISRSSGDVLGNRNAGE